MKREEFNRVWSVIQTTAFIYSKPRRVGDPTKCSRCTGLDGHERRTHSCRKEHVCVIVNRILKRLMEVVRFDDLV